jgi:hypothetical protein
MNDPIKSMAKIALATLYMPNYQQLADIVNKNKEAYCAKHNYDYLKKTENFSNLGFDKIRILKENIENYEWIWWQDLDSIITNFDKKVEAVIDNDYDFIISIDRRDINAGSFLIRNSENGVKILDFILSKELEYKNVPWQEQQVIIDNRNKLEKIKIIDQKEINSYLNWHYGDAKDAAGTWSGGDLLLHLPGMNLAERLEYINKYAPKTN